MPVLKETVKTDGKRRICIADYEYGDNGFGVEVCRNGFQTNIVTVDREMLLWLRDAITDHIEEERDRLWPSALNEIADECYRISSEHGFHEDHEAAKETLAANTSPEVLRWFEATTHQAEMARMISEICEGLESVRKDPSRPDDHLPDFSNVAIEYADAIIRILDTCGKRKIDIGNALVAKMEYNESRPHKHGKNS